MNDAVRFHLPTKPYNVIAAINRCFAAQGSWRNAMAASSADYNGHWINLSWNDYRGYYVAEYTWGGRNVVTRSSDAVTAIREAVREYERQGLGASLHVSVRPEDADAVRASGLLREGAEPEVKEWYTWAHELVGHAYWLETKLGVPATAALLVARDKEDFEHLCSREGRNEIAARRMRVAS